MIWHQRLSLTHDFIGSTVHVRNIHGRQTSNMAVAVWKPKLSNYFHFEIFFLILVHFCFTFWKYVTISKCFFWIRNVFLFHLSRCWGWLPLLNWKGTLTWSLLLKLPSRKLEPWFILWIFFVLRLLCISTNLPYNHMYEILMSCLGWCS